MKRNHFQVILLVWLVIAMSTIVFLAPGHAKEKAVQTGDVVFVTKATHFSMVGGDPVTLAGAGQAVIPSAVFDSLAERDADGNVLPGLAKSWKIAPDWSYIDFVLREGVKFHNGAEVTAEDVKYSLETYMRKGSKFATKGLLKRSIKKIEVQGPYKIRFNLKSPWPWWYEAIPWPFPKEYREKVGDKGFAKKPIGAGSFRWVDYKQDRWVKLAAVKDHYRKTPEFKTLKLMAVPEASTRLVMLKSGEADIVGLIGPHIQQVRDDPEMSVKLIKDVQEQCLIYADLALPDKPSPWHDKRVRIAASMAIDRKAICEKILFGLGTPTGEVISPVTRGYDPSVKPDPYNPEAAKALLAEAGYSKGFKTVISTKQTRLLFMQAIAANLADVGINAELKVLENAAWNEGMRNKKFQGLTHLATFFGGSPHVAKDGLILFTKLTPWCYNTTPEIEATIMKSMFAISEADMTKAGRQISKLIRESRIRMPLWNNHVAFGLGPRIEYWGARTGFPT
ncbi:MAG: ABC transporter substrate-binding protein, partial [Deltaproteobacteria bacterium]|nr:ABC transporter substrate-binding protein [Deltaproteobacteria bacterium]